MGARAGANRASSSFSGEHAFHCVSNEVGRNVLADAIAAPLVPLSGYPFSCDPGRTLADSCSEQDQADACEAGTRQVKNVHGSTAKG